MVSTLLSTVGALSGLGALFLGIFKAHTSARKELVNSLLKGLEELRKEVADCHDQRAQDAAAWAAHMESCKTAG